MDILKLLTKYKLLFIETQNVAETAQALANYRTACDVGRGTPQTLAARPPTPRCSRSAQPEFGMRASEGTEDGGGCRCVKGSGTTTDWDVMSRLDSLCNARP